MRFSIEIGKSEKHRVEFEFNQIIGWLTIKVNGKTVKRDLRFLSFNPVKTYAFSVGEREQIHVRIEKERRIFLSFLYPQRYRVFVNEELVQSYEGY
jgi:hypothetical protein